MQIMLTSTFVIFTRTGNSFEVKIEDDSSDVTDYVQDDEPRTNIFVKESLKVCQDLNCVMKQYSCTQCEKRFTTKHSLTDHIERHTGEYLYSCSQCQNALSAHVNIHTGKYKCTECGRCCKKSSELAVHRRSHSGQKPFECTVCSKRFTISGHLVRHSRIHSGEKPYKCSLCNKSFSQSGHLQRHVRYVHSDRRPYQCPYCGMMFKTNCEARLHVRVHTGAKPYSCRHCSDRFMWFYQLKRHLLESHNEGTWLTCNICEKKFSHSQHFKIHVRRHECNVSQLFTLIQ